MSYGGWSYNVLPYILASIHDGVIIRSGEEIKDKCSEFAKRVILRSSPVTGVTYSKRHHTVDISCVLRQGCMFRRGVARILPPNFVALYTQLTTGAAEWKIFYFKNRK